MQTYPQETVVVRVFYLHLLTDYEGPNGASLEGSTFDKPAEPSEGLDCEYLAVTSLLCQTPHMKKIESSP